MVECRIYIRLPKEEKPYYEYNLKRFCDLFGEKIKAVEFGKQDLRGSVSISLIDLHNCIPYQKHFYNKWELLGFVCGFVDERKDYDFGRFLKKGGL